MVKYNILLNHQKLNEKFLIYTTVMSNQVNKFSLLRSRFSSEVKAFRGCYLSFNFSASNIRDFEQ